MRTLLTTAATLTACLALGAADAQAYGWANGFGLGVGGLYRSLDYPTEQRVPYFAAHPPVYYSVPVPRTYGYSPFAYGPNVRTPELAVEAQPVEVVNPYVPSSARDTPKSEPKQERSSRSGRTISSPSVEAPAGPLMIVNPFFEGSKARRAI